LDLDRVPAFEGVTGRVGITFLPGKKWSGGRAGDHWRDVATDAAQLRELEVDTLLLLVEDHELEHGHVSNIGATLAAKGVALVRFPILDPRTPTNGPAFRAVVADLVSRVRGGEFVAIACRGGLDRSGMAAACLLREAGLEAEQAIDRVHAARKHTLTLVEQQRYVHAWPPG
jgi:ADP-ribosyl-[dinitrogen reductase] hydrolase